MLRGGVERLKPPIIEDQKVGSAEIAQDAGMAPVAARQREVFEQTGRTRRTEASYRSRDSAVSTHHDKTGPAASGSMTQWR
jgi:hypothetical protein